MDFKRGYASAALDVSLGEVVKQGVFVSEEMDNDPLLSSLAGV